MSDPIEILCGCVWQHEPEIGPVLVVPCADHEMPERAAQVIRLHMDRELDWRIKNASRRIDVREKRASR